MVHVFIVASKGIPAQYGGFETFVENLTKGKLSKEIKYHVSCMSNNEKHFTYNDADCFNVRVPVPGAAGRILHVGIVLKKVFLWAREHKKRNENDRVIVYILGCRVGPLLFYYAKLLHKCDITIMCNPDGLEWKREKWNAIEKKFLKYCEKCLVLNSDLIICDSLNIQKYLNETYKKKLKTVYVAYGADIEKSNGSKVKLNAWYKKNNITENNYYLIVGRFVPENNYEVMITEFMMSGTLKDLVIISNVEKNAFYNRLAKTTQFKYDNRIKFVGTVYDQNLLKQIRENAYAYLHGHEVGGTNPSLLEALASTKLNLLLDVGFNQEVGKNAALYWNKEKGNLAQLIAYADQLPDEKKEEYDRLGAKRIQEQYSWELIIKRYEEIFS